MGVGDEGGQTAGRDSGVKWGGEEGHVTDREGAVGRTDGSVLPALTRWIPL